MTLQHELPAELEGLVFWNSKRLTIGCSFEGCKALRTSPSMKTVLERYNDEKRRPALLSCAMHGGKGGKFSKEQIESWPAEHKACILCKEVLPFSKFGLHSGCLFGRDTTCKECRKPRSKAEYEATSIEYRLLNAARHRAKKKGLDFNLVLEDIVIPEVCPVLGTSLKYRGDNSPSIDRIDPSRGYTKDNVRVISKRANILKSNMSLSEARMILEDLENIDGTIVISRDRKVPK